MWWQLTKPPSVLSSKRNTTEPEQNWKPETLRTETTKERS
jgi:hypothetical protein